MRPDPTRQGGSSLGCCGSGKGDAGDGCSGIQLPGAAVFGWCCGGCGCGIGRGSIGCCGLAVLTGALETAPDAAAGTPAGALLSCGACGPLARSCCAQARMASGCRAAGCLGVRPPPAAVKVMPLAVGRLPAAVAPKADGELGARPDIWLPLAAGADAATTTPCGWAAVGRRICWWVARCAAGTAGRS